MIEAVILYHSMCSMGVYRAVGNPSDGDASGAGPESSRGPQPPTQIVIREEIRKAALTMSKQRKGANEKLIFWRYFLYAY